MLSLGSPEEIFIIKKPRIDVRGFWVFSKKDEDYF
jgi:hypothetical protein